MTDLSKDNNLKSQRILFLAFPLLFIIFPDINLADIKDQGKKILISIYQKKRLTDPSKDNNLKSQISKNFQYFSLLFIIFPNVNLADLKRSRIKKFKSQFIKRKG